MEKFLILVMVTRGAYAFLPVADTECDVAQTSQCSATVGGSIYIQIMRNASGHQLRCRKEFPSKSLEVFSLKKESVKFYEASRNRTEFFINNGTMKITDVEKEDSGQYSVEVHTSDGIHVADITFKLDVKENYYFILILVCGALGVIVLLAVCCCLCRKIKNRNTSDGAI